MDPWVVGVDLGGTKIEVDLVDSENRIVGRRRIPTNRPGSVDHETDALTDPPNLAGLHNSPLSQLLAERLRIPVSLEHDAKASALGALPCHGAWRSRGRYIHG
jgi:predicted NBD/HSP70 family sugar kinase